MPRKATSPDEIAQIARVRALVADVGVVPSPELTVTLASGAKHMGRLVQDAVFNKRDERTKLPAYSGAITLATEDGKVEIDYLDIVWLQDARLAPQHCETPATDRLRWARSTPASLDDWRPVRARPQLAPTAPRGSRPAGARGAR